MYSVIECGGFQHKITLGETVKLPKLVAKVGDELTVSDVLLFANGESIKVGAPKVAGAHVKMEVLQHDREEKIVVFKKKRRKHYRRTAGHRQDFTEVLITEIACGPDMQAVDVRARERARNRATAIQAMKIQVKKPTRAEKVAASQAAAAKA